jgi:nucleoside-diphosphate-sugar epimerase
MKFFVIGGAGFIGSHLIELLIQKGHKVYVYDNFSTGKESNLNMLTVTYVDDLETGFKNSDFIFHLAASVGNQYINNNPKISIINNLETTIKVFELAKKYQRPILYTSTSEVYGNSSPPFTEDQDLQIGCPKDSLRWGYSCAKLTGEFLALSYDIPVVIVRPFNLIGPRQVSTYGMVVPSFIEKALNYDNIIVYGDGEQTRCFCDVSEAVVAMYHLVVNKTCYGETCYGEIFNIGNPHNIISILQLAEMIKKLTDSKSNILLQPYSEWFSKNHSDVRHRSPIVNKIRKYIDWMPTNNMETILKKCISNW